MRAEQPVAGEAVPSARLVGPTVAAVGISWSTERDGRRLEILEGVDVEIGPGELTVVSGGRASGKTILLEVLAGLRRPHAGTVTYDGIAIGPTATEDGPRRRAEAMGVVLQAPRLAPELTAEENVELPLLLAGWDTDAARHEALRTLAALGVGALAGARPTELSWSEQRLVGVARALVGDPLMVWADEPTDGLHPDDAATVLTRLHELADRGATVVMTSTDPAALPGVGRALTLEHGRLRAR